MECNNTGAFTAFFYGPFSGWTATALAVSGDNQTHPLWDNVNGSITLWNLDGSLSNLTYHGYGPPVSGSVAVGVGAYP